MDRNEFIGKLQMVYVGDRNALNEIIREYDSLNNIIDELEKLINSFPNISYASSEKIDGERLTGALIPKSKILNKLKELKGSDR